ncbi:MAG: cadherin-like beta sandwich domain-containing protein, partial [Clostridia bacterium]|nr:cadherin-like beta sandwich domain-containing protein [Clostridia bacterium]
MKKWFIIIILLMGVWIQSISTFAEETHDISVLIDSTGEVKIVGKIGNEAGKTINITLMNPSGNIIYVGHTVTVSYGSFYETKMIQDLKPGKYTVSIGALELSSPLKAEVEYGTNASLSGLVLSQGNLNKSFDPEVLEYTASVNYYTEEIKISPTAFDPNSTIEINGEKVNSGDASKSIALLEGENTVNLKVTSLFGTKRDYALVITRTSKSATETKAEVNIDKDQMIVKGNISSGAGQFVLIKIENSKDACIYAGFLNSGKNGEFSQSFALENELKGLYTITIGTLGQLQPLVLKSDYGTNANLESLILDKGKMEPAFSKDIHDYSMKMDSSMKTIKVSAISEDLGATVKINGKTLDASDEITLQVDATLQTIDIEVVAQDLETTEIYRVMLTSDMNLNASLDEEKRVKIQGEATTSEALVSIMVMNPLGEVDYVGYTKSQKDKTFLLNYKFDGEIPGLYSVFVNTLDMVRPAMTSFKCLSMENHLENLTVSGIALSPSFDQETLVYAADVPYIQEKVTITATAVDTLSSIVINNSEKVLSYAVDVVDLAVGRNTILVEVVAENGDILTYKLNLNRYEPPIISSKSSNNALSGLEVSNGTFVNAFNGQILAYNVNVSNLVETVQIKATAEESHAKIKVDGIEVNSGDASEDFVLVPGNTRAVFVEVTAENGNKRIYLLNIKRAVSSNVLLSALTINGGALEPNFDMLTNAYEVHLTNDIESFNVQATTAEESSILKINGSTILSGQTSGLIPVASGSSTTVNVEVEAASGATNTYQINVFRDPSDHAELSMITVNEGVLDRVFTPSETHYSVDVSYDISAIRLTTTTSEVFQTVLVNGNPVISGHPSGNIALNVGHNEISVVVTAQSGTTHTYTIDAVRAPSNEAGLSQLSVKTSMNVTTDLDLSQNEIALNVPHEVTSIQLAAIPLNDDASVTINGTGVNNSQWSDASLVHVGDNEFVIEVTAQDGVTKETYSLTIHRLPSSDASLSQLLTDEGSLSPVFSSGETSYNLLVNNDVTQLTLTPQVQESHAILTIEGQRHNSGEPYVVNGLEPGIQRTITLEVTAEDQVTTETYTINITRALSNNANLSHMIFDSGDLIPAFDKDTISYTMSVANSVSVISVVPTVEESHAVLSVNGIGVISGQSSQEISLVSGGTTQVNVVVTAQDGTEKVYTIMIYRGPSDNANLASLSLSSGVLVPEFSSATLNYNVNVAHSVTGISVAITTEESHAIVKVGNVQVASGFSSPEMPLNPGNNEISVLVTSQSGLTKIYTLNVYRSLTDDANLSHLQVRINGDFVIPLDTIISDFDLSFANNIASVEIVATAVEALSTIELNGIEEQSGYWSDPVPLVVGMNTETVVVTAPDGITTKTYTIRIERRSSSEASLENLQVSSGSLSPVFNSDVTSYTLEVANDVAQITVLPTGNVTVSQITVEGSVVNSGENSQLINLEVGIPKTITIVVTAEDEVSTETYTIVATRSLSDNGNLSSLTLSSGVVIPDFDQNVTDYTVQVTNDITSITVTPTSVEGASIHVNGLLVAEGTPSDPIQLSVGNNLIVVVVEAQNGDTKTYRLVVARAASSNANLTSLVPSEGSLTPVFNAATISYEVTVATDTTSFSITPSAADADAVIRVENMVVASGDASGFYLIDYGENIITVSVTAQDGTTKNYFITVHRPLSSEVRLSSIVTNHGILEPLFDSETSSYNLNLDRTVEELVLWGVKVDDLATITYEVDDAPVEDVIMNLEIGVSYKVEIIVTAQDLTTTQVYTIMVTRLASSDANMLSLVSSSGQWDTEYDPDVEQYHIDVNNDVTSVTLSATKSDVNSTITCSVDGIPSDLTNNALEVSLLVGIPKTVLFTVTAEDETTTKTYEVIVTRSSDVLSNDAYLSQLTSSENGWLDRIFDSNTLTYNLTVYNNQDSVDLTPILNDASATAAYSIDGVDKGALVDSISITDLVVGVTQDVEIVVTAEDHVTTKVYTIHVVRSRLLSDLNVIYNGTTHSLDLNTTLQTMTVHLTEGTMVEITPLFEEGNLSPTSVNIVENTISATVNGEIVEYSVTASEGVNLMVLGSGSIVCPVGTGESVTLNFTIT